MSAFDKIHAIVTDELEKLQDASYFIPENDDMEVAIAKNLVAHNIAMHVCESLEPKQYVRIDGKFYNKAAILSTVKPKGM